MFLLNLPANTAVLKYSGYIFYFFSLRYFLQTPFHHLFQIELALLSRKLVVFQKNFLLFVHFQFSNGTVPPNLLK